MIALRKLNSTFTVIMFDVLIGSIFNNQAHYSPLS